MGAVHEHVKKRRFEDGREPIGFACGGSAGKDKYSAADDGAYTEGREAKPSEGLFEPVFRLVGVGDELIDALGTEKLWVQSPPSA